MSENATAEVTRILVDAGKWLGPIRHPWTYIGYDECNYTYTPEGQELLGKFAHFQERPYYVRTHHLFCTGNCHGAYKWGSTNVYLEDDEGRPTYDWTFIDLILDTILRHHCKPFVEMGFMPQDLADAARYDARPDARQMQSYRASGFACPPNDYDKWYDLIYRLVCHEVERHGADEVATWYWELWNEPDLAYYWKGSVEEFCTLYDYTAAAIRAAFPRARVGGPATTTPAPGSRGAAFLDAFLAHCAEGVNACSGEKGAPLDYVTFHVKGGGYVADPKRRPLDPPSTKRLVDGVRAGYEIIHKYPDYAHLECVLSECDPDGWAAGGAWDNINLRFRNTEYYASYTAAVFGKLARLARDRDWDLKYLTWAFLFVGERCFEGTRAFSTQGIDKPILNLFRMLARLGDEEVSLVSTGSKDPLAYADPYGRDAGPDISGLAALAGNKILAILLVNHHDDWDVAGEYPVSLAVENLPFDSTDLVVRHYRIDATHSNAHTVWMQQGQPMYPTPGQDQAIRARDGLEMLRPAERIASQDGRVTLGFTMPVHSVSLLTLTPQE